MSRRVLSGFLTMLAVLALSAPLYAAETITHQGRLLDASDKPVADGFYGATFSLWDDPVAGDQVWSELRDIQTKSGLFSVELGEVSSFSDIFTEFADRDLYLQVQVQVSGSTETLAPRLRIGTVPFSSVSRRVHALHNGPTMRSLSSLAATDSGAVSSLSVDLDSDGVPDRSIDQDCDGISASLHVTKSPPNIGSSGQDGVSLVVDDASSSSVVAHDLDADGVLDMVVSSTCDATSAKHAINTKGTGGTRSASVTSSTSSSGASSVCSLDLDGDGVLDRRVDEDCDDVSASRSMSFFDIFTEATMDQDCDATGARLAINSKGTSAKRTVACATSESSASLSLHADDDGDGVPERGIDDDCDGVSSSRSMSFFDIFTELSIEDVCDATSARRRVSSHGIGSSGEDGVEITALPGSSSVRCDSDSDGDGLAESSVSSSSGSEGCDLSLSSRLSDGTPARISTNFTVARQTQQASFGERCFVDGDDVPENEVSHSVSPTSSRMAIKTKGTGAAHGRSVTVSSITDESSAVQSCDIDDDGDAVPESEISQTVLPTTCSVAIKTKGTGADANRSSVSSSSSPSSASIVCDQDSDDDGLADVSVGATASSGGGGAGGGAGLTVSVKDASYRGHVTVLKAAAVMTDMDSDGNAYFDGNLSIGVPGTHRVDVEGGAYCDGTNWVNASDENSKENFESVDGEELLDKIADLEITKWNYKGDTETEHIGPTAQDFKETFGVGSDGKSISTIDPSGIALAAIKELNKRNAELEAQVADLKKMVEELAKKK